MKILKKKTALLISIFLVFSATILAKPRTSNEALTIANSFKQKTQGTIKRMYSTSSLLKLAYTCTDNIATRSSELNAYYYVFNVGDNSGFIIVSGDDKAKEILGYSDSGSFDINTIPSNCAAWLSFYQKELKALMKQPETNVISSQSLNARGTTSYASTISPLLGGIKWDQGTPYNNMCPIITDSTSERAVTGCIATAMAQVMKYHRWPVHGTGSNSYTPKDFSSSLSVDFSQATYDWDNMTDTYNSLSNQIQKNAVATIMYHAGVASFMNYGKSSGSSYYKMASALKNNFGYDINMQCYQRDYYSESEWVNLIKAELNSQRPVLYRGATEDVGHEFVCDGYDSNNLFHINWGWSGSYDGYFELSALTPSSMGIYGFNYGQAITLGVQKPTTTSTVHPFQLYLYAKIKSSATTVNRSDSFDISMEMYNMGLNKYSGNLGLALYNTNGLAGVIMKDTVADLNTNWGWSDLVLSSNIPSSIENGNYKLYPVSKGSEEAEWHTIRGKIGTPNYFNVSVTSSNVTISAPDVLPKLVLNSITTTGNLYEKKTGRFNVSITNTGGEYNSTLLLMLKSATNDTITQKICTIPINIPTGETKSFYLTGDITKSAGQYYLYTMYDPENNNANTVNYASLGNPLNVEILTLPTESPIMTLDSKISLADTTIVRNSNVELTAHIKNTGGYFNNYLGAFVFPKAGGSSLISYGFQEVILDKNEEATFTFSGNFNFNPGQYQTQVRYWTGSTWAKLNPNSNGVITFTIVDEATAIEQTAFERPLLYPNPATDKLYLQSDELVKSIRITNLSGNQVLLIQPNTRGNITIPVSELSAGTYILQLTTDSGIKVIKFIKK